MLKFERIPIMFDPSNSGRKKCGRKPSCSIQLSGGTFLIADRVISRLYVLLSPEGLRQFDAPKRLSRTGRAHSRPSGFNRDPSTVIWSQPLLRLKSQSLVERLSGTNDDGNLWWWCVFPSLSSTSDDWCYGAFSSGAGVCVCSLLPTLFFSFLFLYARNHSNQG